VGGGLGLTELDALIKARGYKAVFLGKRREPQNDRPTLSYEIRWTRAEVAGPPADLIEMLEDRCSLISFEMTSGADR
jgi:putative Mg2+ transporter-C (MgtC) family protein